MNPTAFTGILERHGIANPEKSKTKASAAKRGRYRGRLVPRGRGGFGRGLPPSRALGTVVRGFGGRGVGRPFPAAGAYRYQSLFIFNTVHWLVQWMEKDWCLVGALTLFMAWWKGIRRVKIMTKGFSFRTVQEAVSYTHLTLPTIYSV